MPLVSAVRVQRFIEIDGQNAETKGVRDFAKQHDRSSWSGLSGVERWTLVQGIYRSPNDAFPQDRSGLHAAGAWNARQQRDGGLGAIRCEVTA